MNPLQIVDCNICNENGFSVGNINKIDGQWRYLPSPNLTLAFSVADLEFIRHELFIRNNQDSRSKRSKK